MAILSKVSDLTILNEQLTHTQYISSLNYTTNTSFEHLFESKAVFILFYLPLLIMKRISRIILLLCLGSILLGTASCSKKGIFRDKKCNCPKF